MCIKCNKCRFMFLFTSYFNLAIKFFTFDLLFSHAVGDFCYLSVYWSTLLMLQPIKKRRHKNHQTLPKSTVVNDGYISATVVVVVCAAVSGTICSSHLTSFLSVVCTLALSHSLFTLLNHQITRRSHSLTLFFVSIPRCRWRSEERQGSAGCIVLCSSVNVAAHSHKRSHMWRRTLITLNPLKL